MKLIGTSGKVEGLASPPSRAAWIEILHLLGNDIPEESPPSRAAWIEILIQLAENPGGGVAAFTGGVD